MKFIKYLAFAAMTATTLSLSSCSSDDDDDPKPEEGGETETVTLEAITLSQTTANVKVGETLTLTATLVPSNAEGVIEWTSSDATVATVADGVVTGVKVGDAYITASVGNIANMCKVSVKSADSDDSGYASAPKGTNFFVFQMDGQTYSSISSNVTMDLRVDETAGKYLYIWDGTYNAGNAVGRNVYGVAEGWVSLTVASVGWSGMGLCYGDDTHAFDLSPLYDIYANPDDYYLHIAMRSEDNAAHCLILYGMSSEAKFGIGGAFTDNGTTYESLGDFPRDGSWGEIEVPMSKFINAGLIYPETWQPTTGQNLIAFLSGGANGTQLQYDALYIYKPTK